MALNSGEAALAIFQKRPPGNQVVVGIECALLEGKSNIMEQNGAKWSKMEGNGGKVEDNEQNGGKWRGGRVTIE